MTRFQSPQPVALASSLAARHGIHADARSSALLVSRSHSLIVFLFLLASAFPNHAATNELRPWNDYQVILWTGSSPWKQPDKVPLFFQRIREMGVTAVTAHDDGRLPRLLENHTAFYVENLVTKGLCLKFSSTVTDWSAFVTKWVKDGRLESGLVRDYCLDDPKWRATSRQQMQSMVRKFMPHAPLAYDIRDELSVTVSANPFDYDFNPLTLAKFRLWLQTQYADLAALNVQWQTQFASWDDVKPFTTDQIKNRMASGEAMPRGQPEWQALQRLKFDPLAARQSPTRWNFSPWQDFRTYMDISLAETLADLRAAGRELDPHTPAGIEGTQMPSAFGGYDLWRLSQVLDWVEPYDIGNAREIFGSFMPGKTFMTTVFEKDTDHAQRRLWHLLLLGDRGSIIWWSEDCIDWKSADYALTAKGRALAAAYQEVTSPLAKLFMRARRQVDPVLIHYSQAGIQADWLLESCGDGSSWLRRFSSYEATHNRHAQVRNAWVLAVEDLGYTPRFVATAQIEAGELQQTPTAALILPDSLALSDREAAELKKFTSGPATGQRTLLADGSPGLFDPHGRLRTQGALEALFPPAKSMEKTYALAGGAKAATTWSGDISAYNRERLQAEMTSAWPDWLAQQLSHVPREVTLPATARVRVHRYELGEARLLAFERNIDYRMSEDLKQAGGNEALEKPLATTAKLAKAAHVYDLRAGKYVGFTDTIALQLDPWKPALYAVMGEKLAPEVALARLQQAAR
jgi:hypothetical protein